MGSAPVHLAGPREAGRLFARVDPGELARRADRIERLTDPLLDEHATAVDTEDGE